MRVFRECQKCGILSFLCGGNETSEFSLGGGSSGSILFSVKVKYRAEIAKPQICQNRLN